MVFILFLQLGAGIKKKFVPQQNAIFQLLILQNISEDCRETVVSSPNGPLVMRPKLMERKEHLHYLVIRLFFHSRQGVASKWIMR